ncbi:phosphatidylinositol-specific phospholipase C1-like protein [Edaphobacter sp.]|uniref:phosphatidylinositol-specific phospholipase C1-like protein n=1 Tax=Edaphobacter sp. TaxID=1934404 RepID=UPI002DBB5E2C|nr:phosphatidylinositol-specific phospholipase C1-like protein [Edaphobacter sp.]HEU5341172.1 phosphatidylinositol-specific phospholipase C1-like protein [Edaphobacter sp.]
MALRGAVCVALGAMLCVVAGAQENNAAAQDKVVRLNQIQVIGSHNSYHAGFAPSERKFLEMKNPKALHGLDYHHAPLADQLSGGVRQIELDIFADPSGGRYAHLWLDDAVKETGLPPGPSFDPYHEMEKPGFKVMHMQGFDQRSTCHLFVTCLTEVREWSRAHPHHLPIFILVETKEGDVEEIPNAAKALPFTPAVLDRMDKAILSVFSKSEMVTPDDVRGKYKTLNEAVLAGNWPTLAEARGKVVFLMDQRKEETLYTEGHPSLRGRILFTNAVPGAPDAAFTEQNEGTPAEINALVKQGYLVRTRSDEGTEEARTNDTRRRDEVLASGAQMISTDYPRSEPSPWTKFVVEFPNGLVARCNPVTKPAGCVDTLLGETPVTK